MCLFFWNHKWSKWSGWQSMIITSHLTGSKIDTMRQERTCEKCGKKEFNKP